MLRTSMMTSVALALSFVLVLRPNTAASVQSEKPGNTIGSSTGKALPKATSDKVLTIHLLPPFNLKRDAFGTWEDAGIMYYIKNTAGRQVQATFDDKAGVTVYLQDSTGRVRKAPMPWGMNEGFNPAVKPLLMEVPQDANITVGEMNMRLLFGVLKPGAYTVVVEMPAKRMSIESKPSPTVISKPWRFEIVTLTPALKKKINEPTETLAGVTLETVKTKNKQGHALQALKLTNGSKQTISYTGYEGSTSGISNIEYFGGDGKWHAQFQGLCGTGMIQIKLQPGDSAIVGFAGFNVAPPKKTVSITRQVITVYVGNGKKWHTIAAKPVVYLGE